MENKRKQYTEWFQLLPNSLKREVALMRLYKVIAKFWKVCNRPRKDL